MPTALPALSSVAFDLDAIATATGRVAIFVTGEGKLDQAGRRANRLTRGAVERFVASEGFGKLKDGDVVSLDWPAGMAAEALMIARLERRPAVLDARKAGAAIGKAGGEVLLAMGSVGRPEEVALGAVLRAYSYSDMNTKDAKPQPSFTVALNKPETLEPEAVLALASGVYFTRDLVNAPANVLTTQQFADELEALSSLGVKVEVLDEPELEKLGMGALLGVGIGSESPSKVVVMEWSGGSGAPLALVGKGVVFDTGGISLKPAGGMEDMTMDMGGAGVVAGVMKTLATRKAAANVVGVVGLVENMPDGKAQRPGDVVTSMKGDTIEVINTDAEGRLVLADAMWYTAERFKPRAMVDLATLTGAVIVALGYENAGVFANDDKLCADFLKAAGAEGEGAWRMPLGDGYAKLLKSTFADVKNIGGRWGGSVTAAEFLKRFVPEDLPWMHLDIAGVAQPEGEIPMAPKGASGWGVLALNRLVAETCEG